MCWRDGAAQPRTPRGVTNQRGGGKHGKLVANLVLVADGVSDGRDRNVVVP